MNFLCEKKIELFAKTTYEGWDTWGIELDNFAKLSEL